jgi:serine O-acetyltransferase
VFDNIKKDLDRYCNRENRQKKIISLASVCRLEFFAVLVYRFGHYIYCHQGKVVRFFLRPLYLVLSFLVKITSGIIIPAKCVIGPGLFIGHIGLIIFHQDVIMGANCNVAHDVTIGTLGGGKQGVPVLGDNVMIGSGARILGPIVIGSNVKIGANSVVLMDVGDNSTVVGIPARIVEK